MLSEADGHDTQGVLAFGVGSGADLSAVAAAIERVPGVVSVAPFTRLEAMLSSRANLRPALIRGLDPLVALGMMAGTAGVLLSLAAAAIFDHVSARYVPDFPYKPTTYFDFPWWLILASLAFSISFCVLGAVLPARRAARMEPARVLSGN